MTITTPFRQTLLTLCLCLCACVAVSADTQVIPDSTDTVDVSDENETDSSPDAGETPDLAPSPRNRYKRDHATSSASWQDKVVIVPIKGLIAPSRVGGFHDEFTKTFDRIEREPPRLVILEIDSLGGYVDVCDDMVERIFQSPAPVKALVLRRAISGGAMVATASSEIHMLRGARIGDIQPMLANPMSGEIMEVDERTAEKFETDARAIMRANANANGYPPMLLAAMVTRSFQIYEVHFTNGDREFLEQASFELLERNMQAGTDPRVFATPPRIVVTEGKLLTLEATEAKAYGIARAVHNTREAFFEAMGIDEDRDVVVAEIERGDLNPLAMYDELKRKLAEDFDMPHWMIALLGICLVVGVAGILTESQVPGFGVPGALGICGLAGFLTILFWHGGGRANVFELLLFLIGIVLIVVEIVILPGFGVAGILGFLSFFAGLILMLVPDLGTPYMHGNWVNEFGFAAAFLMVSFSVGVILFLLLVNFGDRIPGMKRIYLSEHLADGRKSLEDGRNTPATDETYHPDPRTRHVGGAGVAVTPLRPSGVVKLDSGERLDVVTRGGLIESGTRVVVAEVAMNRIVVEEEPDKAGTPT